MQNHIDEIHILKSRVWVKAISKTFEQHLNTNATIVIKCAPINLKFGNYKIITVEQSYLWFLFSYVS